MHLYFLLEVNPNWESTTKTKTKNVVPKTKQNSSQKHVVIFFSSSITEDSNFDDDDKYHYRTVNKILDKEL